MKKKNNIILFILLSFISASIISSVFVIRYYLDVSSKNKQNTITNIQNNQIEINIVYNLALIYNNKKETIKYYCFSTISSSIYNVKNIEYSLNDLNFNKYISTKVEDNILYFNFISDETNIYKQEISKDGLLINQSIFNLSIFSKHNKTNIEFKINNHQTNFKF